MTGAWHPLPTGGASTLDELTDVDTSTTAPTDGQSLVWDDASSLWVPGTVAAGAPAAVGARAYRSSNTSIANGTVAAIALNAESFDTDAMHSTVTNPSRLTVPVGKAGKWDITGAINYASNTTGIRMARIHVNGVERSTRTYPPVGSGFPTICQVTDALDLAAGDYIELAGYQDSGGSLTINNGAVGTFLAATYKG